MATGAASFKIVTYGVSNPFDTVKEPVLFVPAILGPMDEATKKARLLVIDFHRGEVRFVDEAEQGTGLGKWY